MAYKRLATMMRIPLEECHFGYFDLLQLKKAYNCCQVLKKRSETYTWEHTDVTKKWLEAKAAGDKEIHDHIGSVRIGTLCFDLIEKKKEKRDKKFISMQIFYVGGIIQDMVMEKTIIHIPMLIGFPDSGLLINCRKITDHSKRK